MKNTITQCKCQQCGHIWFPRKPDEPVKCPRCQSFAWNGPAQPKKKAAA